MMNSLFRTVSYSRICLLANRIEFSFYLTCSAPASLGFASINLSIFLRFDLVHPVSDKVSQLDIKT